MKKGSIGKHTRGLLNNIFGLVRKFLCPVVVILTLVVCAQADAGIQLDTAALQNSSAVGPDRRYVLEISISRKMMILYELPERGKRIPLREYRVGTAVQCLDVYPIGIGHVTAISFNPWWYPTPYSRQVFRKRGIDLPSAIPPGHPLNYMGAIKISLSHRTRKGAIYRIHGNNNPGRVGRRVTGGCFVMYNDDALELARKISVGTEVNILP